MREILFRGRRIDYGEWIEGFLSSNHTISIKTPMGNVDEIVINPFTIGQYTGINDKNGKQIFEGDIVKFTRIDALGWTRKRIGQVLYYTELPLFYIKATTGDSWDWCDCEDLEIIGNIHDNPELLKED